jgi:phosphoglycolate phosphatase
MPAQNPFPCRLFLFDLDGTLIDSKSDIALSLNLALNRMGLRPLSMSKVGDFVGDGVQKLIQRTLREVTGRDPEKEAVRIAMRLYQQEYEAHLLDSTRLYDGVTEALDHLWWASFAVVTNKPERYSRRILDGLGVGKRFRAIVGGDSIQQRKPDPAPLLEAMVQCGASPSDTVMVGDSAVDVCAGKAAQVFTCGVIGGFRGRTELESAGCDLILSSFVELADYFCPPKSSRQ